MGLIGEGAGWVMIQKSDFWPLLDFAVVVPYETLQF